MFLNDCLRGVEPDERGQATPLGNLVSAQHNTFIPKRLREDAASYVLFLDKLVEHFLIGDDQQSDGSVAAYVATMPDAVVKRNRRELIEVLVKAISDSGNFQMEDKLMSLGHQVVLDIEGFFLGFAGPVTADSVFPGTGAVEGLASLVLSDVGRAANVVSDSINRNKRSLHRQRERLVHFHGVLKTYFGGASKVALRAAVGLFQHSKDPDNLRWKKTGRILDLCDAEHFCCKLYITAMNSYSSRTISERPRCCNNYCYPRLNPKPWDESIKGFFRTIWEAYLSLPNATTAIPPQLVPPVADASQPVVDTLPTIRAEIPLIDGEDEFIERQDEPDDAREDGLMEGDVITRDNKEVDQMEGGVIVD